MAWKMSAAKRRALVKLQLRDKKGRWIEMGGGVKWYSSKRKKVISGTVVGSQGNNALVRLNKENPTHEPELVSVPARNIEVVDSKASLKPKAEGTPANETPEFEKPEAVGDASKVAVSKTTPYVKQSDAPDDYEISETSDGRVYISRKDKEELYFPARSLDIGDELIAPEGADPTKPFSIGKAWARKGAESVNTTGPKLGKVIDIKGDRYAIVQLSDGVSIDDPKNPGQKTDKVTVGLSNSVIKATPGLKQALGDHLNEDDHREDGEEEVVPDAEEGNSDHEGREVPDNQLDDEPPFVEGEDDPHFDEPADNEPTSEEDVPADQSDEDAPIVDDEQIAAEEAERKARDEDLARRVAERQAKLDEMGDQYDEEGLTVEEQNMIVAYERMANRAADQFDDKRAAIFFAKAEEIREKGKQRLEKAGVSEEDPDQKDEKAPENAPEPEKAPEPVSEDSSPAEEPTADPKESPKEETAVVVSRRMGYPSATRRISDAMKENPDNGVQIGDNDTVEVTDLHKAQDFLRDVVADIDKKVATQGKSGKVVLNRDRREIGALLAKVNEEQIKQDGERRPHKALRDQETKPQETPEEKPKETPEAAPEEKPEESPKDVSSDPQPDPEPTPEPDPTPEADPEPEADPTPAPEPVAEDAPEADTAEEVHPLDALGIERRTPEAIEGEKYPPTQQQQDVIDAVLGGLDTKVQAMAGTGKTSTLEALSRRLEANGTKAVYIAFNKTVQTEAEERMPKNVEARTGHSLAHNWAAQNMPFLKVRLEGKDPNHPVSFRNGKPTAWAKKSAKTSSRDIARELGLENGDIRDGEGQEVSKGQAVLAIKKTVNSFMLSDSDNVDIKHVPDSEEMNFDEESKRKIAEFANAYWNDLSREDGVFRVTHDTYRKHWALSRPDLTDGTGGNKAGASVLYIDEAQDTPPVLAKVVADQKMQKVIVGDQNQAIYAFAENIDYLSEADGDIELPLNKSWRFGPEVADIGNRFLQLLGSEGRVVGGGEPSSIVRGMEDADAVLVRTNAGMIGAILEEAERGRRISAPDGTRQDLSRLANTVEALMDGYVPDNPHDDLIGYKDWGEVREAADNGDRSLGKLITMFDKKNYGEGDDPVKIRADQMARVRKAIDSLVMPVATFNTVKTVQEGDRTYLDAADDLPADKKKWAVKNFSQDLGEVRAPWAGKSDMTWAEKKSAFHEEGGLEKDGWKMDRKTWRYYTEDPAVVAKFASYEGESDVTVSTAHKSKGLEWDRVRMGDDFFVPREDPKTGELVWPDDADGEHKLAYVAVTRARKELDPGVLDYVFEHTDPNGGDPKKKKSDSTSEDTTPEAAPEQEDTPPTPEQAADEPPLDETPDTEASLDDTVEESTSDEPVAETKPSPYNEDGLTETEQKRADELGDLISEIYRGNAEGDLTDLENEWNDILAHGERRLAGEDLPEYQKPEPVADAPEADVVDETPAPVVESTPEPEPTPVLQEPTPDLVPKFDDEGLTPQERQRANQLEQWINDVYRGRGNGNVKAMEDELHDLLQKGAKRLKGEEKPTPREVPEEAPKGRKPRQSYDGVPVLDANGREIAIGDTIGHPRLGPVQVTGMLAGSGRVLYIDPTTGKEASTKAANVSVMDVSTETPEIPAGEPGTRFTDPATGKKGFYNADGTPILKDDRVRNAEGRTGTVVGVYAKDGKAWVPVQWDDTGATTRVMGNLLWPENDSDARGTGNTPDTAPESLPEAPETVQEPDASPYPETDGPPEGYRPKDTTPQPDEDFAPFIEAERREQRAEALANEAVAAPVGSVVTVGNTTYTKFAGQDGYDYWEAVTSLGGQNFQRYTYTNYDFASEFVRKHGYQQEFNPAVPLTLDKAPETEPDGFHEGLPVDTFMPSTPGSNSGLRKVGDDRWEMVSDGEGIGKFAGDAFAKMLFDATSPELIKPQKPKSLKESVADYSGSTKDDFSMYNWQESGNNPNSARGMQKFAEAQQFMDKDNLPMFQRVASDANGNSIVHGSKVWNARTGKYEGVVYYVTDPTGIPHVQIINPDNMVDARGHLNLQRRKADRLSTVDPSGGWDTSQDIDFSSAMSVNEVNARLAKAYPSVHFKISPQMDLKVAQGYAANVSKMFNKYPMLQHQMHVVNTEMDYEGSIAYVRAVRSENAAFASLTMSMNELRKGLFGDNQHQTHVGLINDVRQGSDEKHFNNVPEGREIEYVVTHEFGHALDSLTGWADRDDHKSEIYQLMEEFLKDDLPEGTTSLGKWMHDRGYISGYSLAWGGGVNYRELMAEAFADVELNGVDAKPFNKLIHKYLMDKLKGLM
jgi:hypothetical protein